jgi:hypothetical protein
VASPPASASLIETVKTDAPRAIASPLAAALRSYRACLIPFAVLRIRARSPRRGVLARTRLVPRVKTRRHCVTSIASGERRLRYPPRAECQWPQRILGACGARQCKRGVYYIDTASEYIPETGACVFKCDANSTSTLSIATVMWPDGVSKRSDEGQHQVHASRIARLSLLPSQSGGSTRQCRGVTGIVNPWQHAVTKVRSPSAAAVMSV